MKNLTNIWLITFLTVLGLGSFGTRTLAQDKDKGEASEAEESSTNKIADTTSDESAEDSSRYRVHRDAIVSIGHDGILRSNETANAVVVVGGNAKVHGKVLDAVVAIGGDIDVDGDVRDTTVAIFGNIRAGHGAKLRNGAVAVFGKIDAADDVTISNPVEIDPGGLGTAAKQWFIHCALKMRPLAPQVGWVWVIAGFFFVVYLLLALLLPRPVELCVGELTRRPATTFLLGLLAKLLIPLVILLLIAIGIGIIAVPFVIAALVFGAMIGKVALLEWVGSGLGRRFGAGALRSPVIAFLIGIVILVLLYMVPVLGLVTFGVVSVWGLGCAVAATFGSFRREMPEKPQAMPAITPDPATIPITPSPSAAPSESGSLSSGLGPEPAATLAPGPAPIAPGPAPIAPSLSPVLPEAVAYPKASLWERLGAAFLDLVLVGVVGALIGGPPQAFIVVLAYFTGMWAWKGTTIGGIVLGLKVVRVDGQSLTFTVSLVRAFATAFAAMIFFLGIIWIAWDKEKQGWHDKIAGTIVLRLPRGTPLVCL